MLTKSSGNTQDIRDEVTHRAAVLSSVADIVMAKSHLAAIWMIANLAGMGWFLVAASEFWIEPELAHIPGVSVGAAFGWFVLAAPIFVSFMLAHVAGLVWIMRSKRSTLGSRALPLAITFAFWLAVYVYDNMHHGI